MTRIRPSAREALLAAAKRILIKDGAFGHPDPGLASWPRPIIAAHST